MFFSSETIELRDPELEEPVKAFFHLKIAGNPWEKIDTRSAASEKVPSTFWVPPWLAGKLH